MVKVTNTCNEDIIKTDRSENSLRLYEISDFDFRAPSDEYVGSVLTDLSHRTSRSVSNASICLGTHVSSSLLEKIGFYRPPEDAGIEAFFQTQDKTTSLERYYDECSKYMLVPIGVVRQCLENESEETELDLKNYGAETLATYLICQALVGPPVAQVTRLDFSNNPFDEIGCITLSDLIQQSSHLTHLNLSGCRIGSRSAKVLAEGIEISQSITNLNLSGCHLSDVGGAAIVRAVTFNESCKILDLTKNELQNLTAEEVATLFKENRTLDALNLKWNELYPEKECTTIMFKALQKNENLKELNLSWNGLSGKTFALFMFRALKDHRFLKILNLENNRLSEIELKSILNMIKSSISLEELYLGGNIWSHKDLLELIKIVSGDITLKKLSLGEHIWIPQNCFNLAQQIMNYKPETKIIFKGMIFPNPPEPVDFKALIIDRAKYLAMAPKKKKFKRNMGHFMINVMDDEKELYRRESFEDLVMKFKARLDDDLMGHLANEFSDKVNVGKKKAAASKQVALKEMAKFYLDRHPTERPPPTPAKKKRGKKGKK